MLSYGILRDYKVGEEITLKPQLNGKLYKEIVVVTETPKVICEECAFADRTNTCILLCCSAGCRSDNKNVIFKRKSIERI